MSEQVRTASESNPPSPRGAQRWFAELAARGRRPDATTLAGRLVLAARARIVAFRNVAAVVRAAVSPPSVDRER